VDLFNSDKNAGSLCELPRLLR